MSQEAEILASAAQRVGTLLHGKYHIDAVLGVGGMATVYAATHRNRKRFAVKLLHTEFSVRSDVRTRFVREGYVANSVAHPGVVAVLDDDVDEMGSAFLVMELLDGVTVDALYTTTGVAIPVREALGIIYQLLDVLEVAHRSAVVHRDIKPANLFVLRDGRLKVLDFGIARLRDTDTGLKSTRTGALLGTPAFMAPEQALAVPEHIDARTDVWAAGATLFTMLSACFVHSGENARQIMIRAATEPARSLDSIAPDLPASVVAIVSRALAFERSERWQSAAAMREAVLEVHRALFGSEPVRADVASLVERTSAIIGTQPTQPHPVSDPPEATPGRSPGRPTPNRPLPERFALETTASTPVSAVRHTTTRGARWAAFAFAAAVVAVGGLIALRWPSTRTSNPAPPVVVSQLDVARAVVPQSPLPALSLQAKAPAPPVPASSDFIAPSNREPTRSAKSPTSSRKTRPVPATTATAPTVGAAVAASRAPENPLQLELQ